MPAPDALLSRMAQKLIVTVEDHSVCGGLGEAAAAAVAGRTRIEILGIRGIRGIPRSGKPTELMQKYGIAADSIVAAVKKLA